MSKGIFKCVVCGDEFEAKLADRKRGWAKCCSKSCAAKRSNRITGKYDKYLRSVGRSECDYEDDHPCSSYALGQD